MNSLSTTSYIQKDTSKGQKIVAAVYLVSNHLSDSDPIKSALRSSALRLLNLFSDINSLVNEVKNLQQLLNVATLAGLISEKNSSIISFEAEKYSQNLVESVEISASFFTNDEYNFSSNKFLSKGHSLKSHPFRQNHKKELSVKDKNFLSYYTDTNVSKKNGPKSTDRAEKILSFMSVKKSATIKDITNLFPEVSEKTIQRELNSLINSERLIKRGSKRWSVYIAVDNK